MKRRAPATHNPAGHRTGEDRTPYARESFGVCTSSCSTFSMTFALNFGARHSLRPILIGRDLEL